MICRHDSHELPDWVPSESSCVVDYCRQLMDMARKETCGECVFCREGTWQVYEIIKDITEGNSESDDYELLLDVLTQIKAGTSCELPRAAATQCLRLLKDEEEEWEKHIRRKRCAGLICRCSYTLYIDPLICDGCGDCLLASPDGVIVGGPGMIHVVNTDAYKNRLLSISACPKQAIKKAGPVKPKLPEVPVPAGSFQTGGSQEEGDGLRRRRRRG